MKSSIFIFTLILICTKVQTQIEVESIGVLPEPVANNAVCEGFINDTAYVFSFGGMDTSKIYSGIHTRCFKYNIESGESERIPDLPDEREKIASWASRVGDIIYVAGGYYVGSDDSEESSRKMHRYDIINNIFLGDAAEIPRAIDDQVQAVWRDSLIYLVTGWSNNGNTTNVQIYNPSQDSWVNGTAVPNTNDYKSFGSSGSIIGDTIYYFGGASSSGGFNVQGSLRKGVINPDDPTEIIWSMIETDETKVGYRMASTAIGNRIYWIGGSEVTYNFDGVAYNGSGGVDLSNRVLGLEADTLEWEEYFFGEVPMDLRGIADVSKDIKYLAGGMVSNQEVTDKIYRINFAAEVSAASQGQLNDKIKVYPNPCRDKIYLESELDDATFVNIYSMSGESVFSYFIDASVLEIDISTLIGGTYLLRISTGKEHSNTLLVKL